MISTVLYTSTVLTLVYPTFINDANYFQEFWRTYLINEIMIQKLKHFTEQNIGLNDLVSNLEVSFIELTFTIAAFKLC